MAIHGALRAASDLSIIAASFPDTDCWLIDLPGHGESPFLPTDSGFNPDALAADIAATLAPTDGPGAAARPVVIIGESFSGITALYLAHKLGNTRRVVLLDTPLDTVRMRSSQLVILNRWMQQEAQRPFLATLARDFFGLDVEKRTVTPRTYHADIRNCPAPVTMITGTIRTDTASGAGAFLDETDKRALSGIDDFQITEIPGAGHSVLRLNPAGTIQALGAILANINQR